MEYIVNLLKEKADVGYADFHSRLVPTIERERILGVRTPDSRALAKTLVKDKDVSANILPQFLEELPHYYYDEALLHGEIISLEKDYDMALALTEKFLPYVDNWAVCDMLSPKVFAKNKADLFNRIKLWLKSDRVYTVRFGIDMMIKYFLDEEFDREHLDLVRDGAGDDYYIRMAKAWYFSIALVKHYEVARDYVRTSISDEWIKKKSIQKARESYRLSEEQKQELKLI